MRRNQRMTAISLETLRQHPLFGRFDEAVLMEIQRNLQLQRYPAGATVFAQNDEEHIVYIVLAGHVRLTSYSHSGREVVLHDLFPGDLVGELSAIDGAPRGADMTVVAKAELARLSAADFNRLLRQHPDFAMAILGRLTRVIRSLNRRLQLLAAPVPTRVCAELFRLAEVNRLGADTARIVPAPKHVDIANRINTHREAVSRTMSELQRHRIIRRGQGELLVLDLAALHRLADGGALPSPAEPTPTPGQRRQTY